MLEKGIYIYGIVPNLYGDEIIQSVEKSGIYSISYQDLSAMVSNWESTQFDLSDRESLVYLLAHHQKTIETIEAVGFNIILPMKFRTIVHDKSEVLTILSNGYELIKNSLKNIENLTEVDLAVTWADFGGVLNEIAKDPNILEIKNKILKNIDRISQIDQAKIGMLIHENLIEKNRMVELNILDSLSSISLDIKTHEVMNDQMVTNSAFLIKKNKKEKFEQKIDQLDAEFKDQLSFKLVGPLPCYSFYTIEVKALNPEQIVQAKNGLGLKDETSESEIKKAYLEKVKLFHPDSSFDGGGTEKFNMIQNAFHTLLDYTAAAKQSSKESLISLAKDKLVENLILVKIKE